MSGIMMLLLAGVKKAVVDPFFNYVTLLLPGNGTNGAQNNTFVDSSTNNFTITRNGNTTQGTFSPFSQTGWGVYQGAIQSDYASFTTSAGSLFEFTGDFTVEAWVYYTSNAADGSLWITTGASFFALNIDSTNYNIYLNAGTPTSSFSHGISLNAWTHVAMVRSGSTVTVYTNGVSKGTITNSSTLGYQNPTLARFGGGAAGSNTRYVSNLRIVKGTAVYTAAFTPPTTPLTAISGTSLLTCQSNRFLDASSNALVATVTGSPSIQAFSPFNPTASWDAATYGGSGYFDGSGDYLSGIGTTSSFNFMHDSSALWTFECWLYTSSTSNQFLIDNCGSATGNVGVYIGVESSQLVLLIARGVSSVANAVIYVSDGGTVPTNQWVHLAVTYDQSQASSNAKFYINGVNTKTANKTANAPSASNATNAMTVAAITGGSAPVNGYLSNLRISNSIVYSSAFTPPTSPVTGGSLLLNFTNAGIYDATSKNDLETVGNAQISTTQSKFGGSSMYFDGTGDYLTSPANPLCRLMGGDFTVEMWVRLAASQSNVGLVSSYSSNNGWLVRLDTSAIVFSYGTGGAATVVSNSASLSTGVWYHIAWTKSGTTLRSFVDGVQVGSNHTVSSAVDTTNTGLQVGRTHTVTNDLNGYIDDLRITKGIARYTGNFTPPTSTFPLL